MERERAEAKDDRLPVHYVDPRFGEERLAKLEAELHPRIRLTTGPDLPADVQIRVAGRPRREQIEASPHLHTLVIPWAGLPESTQE